MNTSIAELKKNPVKVTKEKQKISDGIRECWYGGSTNNKGMPNGEGLLIYENKDNFKGKFKVSFLSVEIIDFFCHSDFSCNQS